MFKVFWALLARQVERHYAAVLVEDAALAQALDMAADVGAFCEHSGFLRDGRYPGGRHAERKLRSRTMQVADTLREGTALN